MIASIGEVRSSRTSWHVGNGRDGEVTATLRHELVGIRRGSRPDAFGWVETVVPGPDATERPS